MEYMRKKRGFLMSFGQKKGRDKTLPCLISMGRCNLQTDMGKPYHNRLLCFEA